MNGEKARLNRQESPKKKNSRNISKEVLTSLLVVHSFASIAMWCLGAHPGAVHIITLLVHLTYHLDLADIHPYKVLAKAMVVLLLVGLP